MTPSELEKYLHDHIPLSKAMEVAVVQALPEKVILSAPLAPNINHRDTVFGGSASAVAILASWSLLHTRLSGEGIASRLVIQRNTMSYERPIDGTFTAEAVIASVEAWEQFLRMLKRRGKARITVASILHYAGQVAGRLEGDPGVQIEMHIYVGSKAPWDHIGGNASQFEERPPSSVAFVSSK